MTYGLRIFNANGDTALDLEKVLVKTEAATAKKISTLISEASAAAAATGRTLFPQPFGTPYLSTDNHEEFCIQDGYDLAIQKAFVATTSTATHKPATSHYSYAKLPTDGTLQDMIFVDIQTRGLVGSIQNIYNLDDGTPEHSVTYLFTEDGNPPDYIRATPVLDPGALPGTHGMQLFDDAGGLLFDSRAELFSIFQSFNVTQSQVNNVLANNASYDFTLSKPAPTAKVCAPFFGPWRHDEDGWAADKSRYCRLKQIDSTTIRLSRVTQTGRSFGGDKWFTHGFSFFVGR